MNKYRHCKWHHNERSTACILQKKYISLGLWEKNATDFLSNVRLISGKWQLIWQFKSLCTIFCPCLRDGAITYCYRRRKNLYFIVATKIWNKMVRLGYRFTPYQRLWLYNSAPLVAFYDTLGIRRTYSRLKTPASSRGWIKMFKDWNHSTKMKTTGIHVTK